MRLCAWSGCRHLIERTVKPQLKLAGGWQRLLLLPSQVPVKVKQSHGGRVLRPAVSTGVVFLSAACLRLPFAARVLADRPRLHRGAGRQEECSCRCLARAHNPGHWQYSGASQFRRQVHCSRQAERYHDTKQARPHGLLSVYAIHAPSPSVSRLIAPATSQCHSSLHACISFPLESVLAHYYGRESISIFILHVRPQPRQLLYRRMAPVHRRSRHLLLPNSSRVLPLLKMFPRSSTSADAS